LGGSRKRSQVRKKEHNTQHAKKSNTTLFPSQLSPTLLKISFLKKPWEGKKKTFKQKSDAVRAVRVFPCPSHHNKSIKTKNKLNSNFQRVGWLEEIRLNPRCPQLLVTFRGSKEETKSREKKSSMGSLYFQPKRCTIKGQSFKITMNLDCLIPQKMGN